MMITRRTIPNHSIQFSVNRWMISRIATKIALPTRGPASDDSPPSRLTRTGSAEWVQWAMKGRALLSRSASSEPASPANAPLRTKTASR